MLLQGVGEFTQALERLGARRQRRIQAKPGQPRKPSRAEAFLQRFAHPALALAVTADRQTSVRLQMQAMHLEGSHQVIDAHAAARRYGERLERPVARGGKRQRARHVGARALRGSPEIGLGDDNQVRDLDDAGLHELQGIARPGLDAEHDRVGDARNVGLRLADAHRLDQHTVEQGTH